MAAGASGKFGEAQDTKESEGGAGERFDDLFGRRNHHGQKFFTSALAKNLPNLQHPTAAEHGSVG